LIIKLAKQAKLAEARAAEALEADKRLREELAEIAKIAQVRSAEADKRSAEADKRAAEADERLAKLDQTVSRVSLDIGRLGNRLGEWVEKMVEPAAVRLFQERGIEVHEVFSRARAKRDGEAMEVDLLVINNTDTVAIECKSNLSMEDVDKLVADMAKFKKLFPRFVGNRIMAALATMNARKDVADYAQAQGFFLIMPNGANASIANDAQFQARAW
jgi:hypothetical protein